MEKTGSPKLRIAIIHPDLGIGSLSLYLLSVSVELSYYIV